MSFERGGAFALARFHSRIFLSLPAEASVLPSGLKARVETPAVCPSSVPAFLPLAMSHSLMFESWLAEAERFAVGAERHARDRRAVPLQRGRAFAAGDIPQPDTAIQAPRGNRLAIRAEGDRRNPAGVPGERGGDFVRSGVPQFHSMVVASGGNRFAIRAECGGRNPIAVGRDCGDAAALAHVPQLDCFVISYQSDFSAVGA